MRAAHIVYLLFGGQCKGPGFPCMAWRDPSLCPPIVHPSGSLHAHISQKGNCGGCSPLFPNLPRSQPVGASRHWQGPLVLSTAFLVCHSLPVATGRVRWHYPPLGWAGSCCRLLPAVFVCYRYRCQLRLAGSVGVKS